MENKNDLTQYKIFGIGIVPLMIIIFVVTLIVIGIYEWW